MNANSVDCRVQRQLRTEWCWAAVTNTIEHFFNPGSPLTQCQVVTDDLGETCCGDLSSSQTEQCNIPSTLHEPLDRLGRLAKDPIVAPIGFAAIRHEIDNGNPIGVLIKWLEEDGSMDRGHFVAITGYRVTPAGTERVFISDPQSDDGDIDFHILRDRKGGYRNGRGVWFATFLVRSTGRGE